MIYFIAFNANTYFVNIIDPMEEDFSKAKMYFMLPGMHLTPKRGNITERKG